ncbi:MAG: extracellular solute-binding protein [Candidatus Zambryskibacteria bacterium]|nr:extracellular solute-binding protein [Candidatus Zambryskibacteria bacterium]
MSKFQLVLLGAFGFFIVIAVAVFAIYRGESSAGRVSLTIWGDISSYDFNQILNNSSLAQDKNTSITYVEKSSNAIQSEFTESLAEGSGPDLVLVTQENFWKQKGKLVAIPYSNISERDFKQTFVEEGELFLGSSGVYALPLLVDPIVLYYNRDLLSAAGFARPLAYWDEIYAAGTKLSKKDAAGNLTQSVMALGEARNISHAKEILSMLLLQAGTPIIDFVGQDLRVELNNNFNLPVSPAESALNFYTQFSNPTKNFYSWNRSLVEAQTHFTSGTSAYYLGFASELRALRNKNPTLNLGVALAPQSRVSGKIITFGRLTGVAVSRGSKTPGAAYAVATRLVGKDFVKSLSEAIGLAPARRDLLSAKPSDANMSVFYDAALQARGWLDPDLEATRKIFNEIMESVTSGRARTTEALSKANGELNALIK